MKVIKESVKEYGLVFVWVVCQPYHIWQWQFYVGLLAFALAVAYHDHPDH